MAWCRFRHDVLEAMAYAFESLLANTREAWRGLDLVVRVLYCGVVCVGQDWVVAAGA